MAYQSNDSKNKNIWKLETQIRKMYVVEAELTPNSALPPKVFHVMSATCWVLKNTLQLENTVFPLAFQAVSNQCLELETSAKPKHIWLIPGHK